MDTQAAPATTTSAPPPAIIPSAAPTQAPAVAPSTSTPNQQSSTQPTGATPQAPVDLEFKLPDGVQADQLLMGEFKPLAKELGLDGVKGQKLVDLAVKMQGGWAKQQAEQIAAQDKAWTESLKSDKEYGGAEFEKSLLVARQALTKFGTPELTQALESSGLGNHPEVMRFVYRVGKALAEDTMAGTHGGQAPKTPATDKETLLRTRYPSMFSKE